MTIQWLRHSIRRFAHLIVILSESEGSILIILCKAKAEDPKIIIKKSIIMAGIYVHIPFFII